MNEAIIEEILCKYHIIKRDYNKALERSTTGTERLKNKKIFINEKIKLFIEYMDHKEELCEMLTTIPSCYIVDFVPNSGCQITGECGACCKDGLMYDYLLKRVNNPKQIS